MTVNQTLSNSTKDLKYSYRPKSNIFSLLGMSLLGIGAFYFTINYNKSLCFLKGIICFNPITSKIFFFIGSLAFVNEAFKNYKDYKASNRDQFIQISNSNLTFPKNTLNPSETIIDFRSIKNISINPLIGKDRKIEIYFNNNKVIIEEKLLEYEGEFEEIWSHLNLLSLNK